MANDGASRWPVRKRALRAHRCHHAVSVNSRTAALHAAVIAAGIAHGEVIVPALSFVGSSCHGPYKSEKTHRRLRPL
jgi:hypothetical protein